MPNPNERPLGPAPWIRQMVDKLEDKPATPVVPEAVAPVTPEAPKVDAPLVPPAVAEAPKIEIKPEEMPGSTLPGEKVEVKAPETPADVTPTPGVPDVPAANAPTVPPVSTQLPTAK